MKPFPHLHQPDAMDCGATCLSMIAKHYGKNYSIQRLREMCSATRQGVSLLGISDAAEKLGFKTIGARLNFEKLANEVPLPCIAHWKQNHFVVVYDIKQKSRKAEKQKSRKAEEQKSENSYGLTLLRSYGLPGITIQNLTFEGKTVVVVAHRLSTVKNADNIVVLEKGKIVGIFHCA